MVNWTAEKDRIILKGIFKFHDFKTSKKLLDFLAAEIGDGCTPKAVSHRLSNLKTNGSMTAGRPGSATRAPRTPSTPRTPRTPASGRGSGRVLLKKGSSKKVVDDEDDEDDGAVTSSDDSENEEPVSPSDRRKRSRASEIPKSYAESDATDGEDEEAFVPATKKAKKGVVEAEGISGSSVHDEVEEEV